MRTLLDLISQARLAGDLGALLFSQARLTGELGAVSSWATVAIAAIAQFVLFVRWLYRRIRNDELMRAFVHDMATNHLPHIYERLEKLCDEQGIDRSPLPPILWVDLNGRDRPRY
jgi:hypothetical protein